MPVSPFMRSKQENQPGGGSVGGRKKRRKQQSTRDRYAHAREDAQLQGLIPTTPEEALTPERVPGSAQGNQPLPELIAEAIRRGWNVPSGMKPHMVDELVQIVLSADMPAKAKIASFNALRMADESQWERDHPELKDGDKRNMPTTVNIRW